MKPITLTKKDKEILASLKPVVDGIAAVFGENCEALLHSFESLECSIVHIANGHITGRAEGAPITDLGMKVLQDFLSSAKTGISGASKCYFSKTADGKTLRSVTVLIKNGVKKPIGMLCINFNMSAPLLDIVKSLTESERGAENAANTENFAASLDELVEAALRGTINAVNSQNNIPNREKNKAVVAELIKKGIFDIRGAVDVAARELKISRYTIYNYMREYKFSSR